MRKFYLSEGYADFRVVSAVAELTPDRDAFILTFTVDEGERYRFGKVDVDIALKDLPREAVLPLLTVRPDDWYNAEAVERSISVLTDALGNRGYAFVEIRPEITRNREEHTVDINFRVQEGPRVYVERIDITGNVRTLDKVIRREFRLVEGDPFNTARMQRSKERIQNLGFFKKVEVTNAPGSAPDRTVIVVDVEEQSTGELSLGVGFSSSDGPLVDVHVRERNFLGRGQDLRLGTVLSFRSQQVDISFTEPYFLDKNIAAGVDLFAIKTSPTTQFLQWRDTGVSTDLVWRRVARGLSDHRKSAPDLEIYRPFRRHYRCRERRLAVHSATGRHASDLRHRPSPIVRSSRQQARADRWLLSRRSATTSPAWVLVSGTCATRPMSDIIIRSCHSGSSALQARPAIFSAGAETLCSCRIIFLSAATICAASQAAGVGPRDIVSGDPLGGNKYYIGTVALGVPLPLPKELGISGRIFTDFGTLWRYRCEEPDVYAATTRRDRRRTARREGYGGIARQRRRRGYLEIASRADPPRCRLSN